MAAAKLLNRKAAEHKKDWKKLKRILGEDLTKDLYFGENGLTDEALRNRLVHGRYFGPQHGEKDHVTLLHRKIVAYFNQEVFRETLMMSGW
jgi:hypothetical protein